VLGQVGRANTAFAVARYRIVDELRVGEIEVAHDLAEFFEGFVFAQATVAVFFLRDGGDTPFLVVMPRVDEIVIRQ
jgi:hypothetical protein